jgi:predicted dehydrogenase
MPTPIRIALVGIGKIARDQHLPALAANPGFGLVAAVSRSARVDGVPNFTSIAALAASGLAVDAVSLCTPPAGRYVQAAAALTAGWHVMLEKPPAASLSQVRALQQLAGHNTLFATWHSHFAAGVAAARAWLAGRKVQRVTIDWLEDIRIWHPGQDWILEAGGLGVFDPGINALSILTEILPEPVRLETARLSFPANRSAPIAAHLGLCAGMAEISATFDFRHTGLQRWDIAIETDAGTLKLSEGGAALLIDGVPVPLGIQGEYPALYQHFAALVITGTSDCDVRPLELVADAFLCGTRETVAPFDF